MKTFFSVLLLTFMIQTVVAQQGDWKEDKKISVLFGLTQPLFASGFNIEGNYIHKRLIFDYSHGAGLKFGSDLVTTELSEQGVVVFVPWTTGFGVGYRFTEWLNLRVEPKWHRFEFYYDGESRNDANRITADNTFSLGLGLYGFFQPFKKQENFLKGITVAPSVRFWPTLSSEIPSDGFSYENKRTGTTEKIETLDSGIGFTPLIVNISIGYTFDLKRKN